ncbi:hypothetical protein BCR41DRAFT_419226 [Lobosporangium transversale]|uniref:Uncharacterized protein n=1 Tax=Lobosporangium transversale TaxID=64571 RepID=A0A1Y2GYT4_9FUNG|nr:hypothetical protein BCR41DRAFT_419225 [Lobosporangium transversale]XP_021885189.1 hypothetical protein BCR41DRAFT_419226 [Lobosporangium transversale]ORZ27459.1 hypothetical protein BCR41DRAFT_419225 [Lobosporangium transversale]ORZ27462.1 hypothetical protein BCR41DRAFT_419226 [Lobosporangium transversale]|eukprot:XP_021885186.1 hypothetical protein BCR41DRAFT_419225 [Lobosporangium transversale]
MDLQYNVNDEDYQSQLDDFKGFWPSYFEGELTLFDEEMDVSITRNHDGNSTLLSQYITSGDFANTSVQMRPIRSWMPLFLWLLDISIVNSYILWDKAIVTTTISGSAYQNLIVFSSEQELPALYLMGISSLRHNWDNLLLRILPSIPHHEALKHLYLFHVAFLAMFTPTVAVGLAKAIDQVGK